MLRARARRDGRRRPASDASGPARDRPECAAWSGRRWRGSCRDPWPTAGAAAADAGRPRGRGQWRRACGRPTRGEAAAAPPDEARHRRAERAAPALRDRLRASAQATVSPGHRTSWAEASKPQSPANHSASFRTPASTHVPSAAHRLEEPCRRDVHFQVRADAISIKHENSTRTAPTSPRDRGRGHERVGPSRRDWLDECESLAWSRKCRSSTAGWPRTSTSTTLPAPLHSRTVLDAVNAFLPYYSSVHRGTGFKSRVSTAAYDQAHDTIARFVGADVSTNTVIFGKNTTEAINKLAYRYPLARTERGALDRDGAPLERPALARVAPTWCERRSRGTDASTKTTSTGCSRPSAIASPC